MNLLSFWESDNCHFRNNTAYSLIIIHSLNYEKENITINVMLMLLGCNMWMSCILTEIQLAQHSGWMVYSGVKGFPVFL